MPTSIPTNAATTRHWRAFRWQRTRPRDVIPHAVFWAVLAIASVLGWLAPVDGRLFDVAMRALPGDRPSQVAVLRRVGPPASAQTNLLLRAGAARIVDLSDADLGLLRPAPGFAPTKDHGCRPPAADGVLRVLRVRDQNRRACPLARLLADARLPVPSANLVSPDYAARTSTSIPRLDPSVLGRTAELAAAVRGRIVLRVPVPDIPMHVTPLYRADGLLEPSIPFAMALDSMAQRRMIRWIGWPADVLAAALVTLILSLSLRRASYRVTLVTTLLASVPLLLGWALALHQAHVHVPATASVVALAGFALRAALRRNAALAATLLDVDHRLTGLVGQPLGQGFEVSTGVVWEQANHFVTEFFDLRRSVMFELVPGATHMQLAAAFGCRADDIIERRRDYRRDPYSTALARELPTAPSRPLLPAEEGVADFLAPLLAAEQLVGFWAFSVAPGPDTSLDALKLEAARYANEVAKQVLRAGTVRTPADPGARRWPQLARLRVRLLDRAAQAREQLAAYRDVFAAVVHPLAVCDLLGRVQIANPAFEDFADSVSQPLLAISVSGLLEDQCGMAPAAAKATMRHIMLGNNAQALVAIGMPGNSLPQALLLRPILRRDPDPADRTPSPFNLLGIMVEIVPDVRDAEAARELGRAARQYALRSHAMLESLSRTLDDVGVDEDTQELLADLVTSGMSDAHHLLEQAVSPGARAAPALARLDLHQALQNARNAHAHSAREKSISVELPAGDAPEVLADGAQVASILQALLGLLVDDAAPNSTVKVLWGTDGSGGVRIDFSNEGYGMPGWHVRDAMHDGAIGPVRSDASPLERVAHAAAALESPASVQLESDLGTGYRAVLTLQRPT